MTFNFIDIIILIIFFCSVLIGFGRGFVSEILSIITLIAAFIVAITFTTQLANYFTSTQTVQSLVSQTSGAAQPVSYFAIAVSFALLFAGTVVVGTLLGYLINAAFQTGVMGIGNRVLGGVFGLIRGYILNVVFIFVVQLTPFGTQPYWQQSYFVNMFQPEVQWIGNLVNPTLTNLKARLGQTIQNAASELNNASSGF